MSAKLTTDNQEELSTDARESIDKLNNNYQLMVTDQCKNTKCCSSFSRSHKNLGSEV